MDPTVAAAIIGAIATIFAAIVGVRWARKPQEIPPGTEGFTQLVRQLGDDRLEVRLEGIYALEKRAKDPEDHWPIMEILTSYIRERVPRKDGRDLKVRPTPEPSPDIQATLKVLGRRTLFYGSGEEQRLDLTNTDLRYANLVGAHLEGMDLRKATLEGTKLEEAHLEGADLREACLAEAVLDRACLEGADLRYSNLKGASLDGARLRHADFRGANFCEVVLHGQNASEANFSETDLSNADLRGSDFSKAFFQGSNLSGSNLSGALFPSADLSRANLSYADLSNTNFSGALLSKANLAEADLSRGNFANANLTETIISSAILSEASFRQADFLMANLSNADLSDADLTAVRFVKTNLEGANLVGCNVYGVSAWDLTLSEATRQSNLIINPYETATVLSVDGLEIAQFVYLLFDNRKVVNIFDAMTSKAVLILGNFTPGRKEVLEAIRTQLRNRDYLPILFDFEGPTSKNATDTVTTVARLSRFVIADVTQDRTVSVELEAIASTLPSLPIRPLIEESEVPSAMFAALWRQSDSVLKLYRYKSVQDLLESFDEAVIAPAEKKHKDLEDARLRDIFEGL